MPPPSCAGPPSILTVTGKAMPRVTTATARKDYPSHGIKKGDTYYHWSFYRGPKQMSRVPPRRSQLTQTPMAGAYSALEALEDAISSATCPNDITDVLGDCASALREVADNDYQGQIDNLSAAFQGGCPALEDAENKQQAIIDCADECESAKGEIEAMDVNDYIEGEYKEKPTTFEELDSADQESYMSDVKEMASAIDINE